MTLYYIYMTKINVDVPFFIISNSFLPFYFLYLFNVLH